MLSTRIFALIPFLLVSEMPVLGEGTSLREKAVEIAFEIENDDYVKGRWLLEIAESENNPRLLDKILPAMPVFHRHEAAARLAVTSPKLIPGSTERWNLGEGQIFQISKIPMRERAKGDLMGVLWLGGHPIPTDEELLSTADGFASRTSEHHYLGRAIVAQVKNGQRPAGFPGLELDKWQKLPVAPELLPVAEAWLDCARLVAEKHSTLPPETIAEFTRLGLEAARASKTDPFPWLVRALGIPGAFSNEKETGIILEEASTLARNQFASGQFDRPSATAFIQMIAEREQDVKLKELGEALDAWIPREDPMRQPALLAMRSIINEKLGDASAASARVGKALDIAQTNPNRRMRQIAAIALLIYAPGAFERDKSLVERAVDVAGTGK